MLSLCTSRKRRFRIRQVSKYFAVLGCIGIMMLGLSVSQSFGQSVTQSLPFEGVSQLKSSLTIPVTSEPGKASIEFPAVQQSEGKVPCLRFKAFLPTDKPAGWGPYLQITLNGKPVGAYMPDGSERLINRIGGMQTTTEGKRNWWDSDTNLNIFFGPENSEVDSRVTSNRGEGYWYLLDISDLANYTKVGVDNRVESEGNNHLVFTNTYNPTDTAVCKEMQIQDVSVAYLPQGAVDKIFSAGIKPIPTISGKTLHGKGFTLTASQSGAMELNIGKDRYAFDAAYSYPGESIGYHRFTWEKTADPDWKTLFAPSGKTSEIAIKGESYRYSITRRVSLKDGKISVADTVTNKTNAPLGMSIRYDVLTPKLLKGSQAYLAGVPEAQSMIWCASNPSMFVKQSGSSAGVVCEDDVFRMQMTMTRQENAVQYATEHFGLRPKKSYTIQWMIYPSRDTHFFSFVNRVRKDWHVNYTIPGPFVFTDNHYAEGRTTKLYAIHPFFLYADGGHLSKEEYAAETKPVIKELLAKQPDAIPLGMVETNLVNLDRNKLNASITMERKYGLELNKAQTEVLEKSPLYGPWADSWPRTADGRAVVDTYYAYKPNLMNMMTYPVIGNHQFDYMKWQIDYLMDKIGCKGIYMDQFDVGYDLKAVGRPDYSKWDGHTVDLDSRGEIAAKYTDATLVGTPAREALIKHILKKGGVVVTNGHSCSLKTTGLPVYSFTETEWACDGPRRLLREGKPPALRDMEAGLLDSPIGLGIRPTGIFPNNKFAADHFSEIVQKWVITCLRNGILYYYYMSNIPSKGPGAGDYGVINYMFPFTPVELHPGWMIGKERTLTAVSGKYMWNHPDKPVCLVFDLKGYRVPHPKVKMVRKGKAWQVDLKLSDWNETAVIMSAKEK